MTTRSYGQYCAVARALDLVGERWALLVVRELVLGPKRFTELREGLPGIGTNVLSARLRELERGEVIRRRRLPPPAASTVYELTESGRGLEEILLALGRWGLGLLGPLTPDSTLRSGWLGVALLGAARPEAAREIHATLERLRLDDAAVSARIAGGAVHVAEGETDSPDLVIETSNATLVGLLAGQVEPDEALDRGLVSLEGDRALYERALAVFRFEEPAIS